MHNNFAVVCAIVFVLFVGLGCGMVERITNQTAGSNTANSNKTLTDTAVDTAVGEQKIGVPECDAVMDLLTAYANNPDDNFVVKAGKTMVVNKIKESIKQSIEVNKADKSEIAKTCKEARVEVEKFKAEEDKKAANK